MSISNNIVSKFNSLGTNIAVINTLTGKPLNIELVERGVKVILRSQSHIFPFEAFDEIERKLETIVDHKMIFGNSVMLGHKDHMGEIGYGLDDNSINGYYGIHFLHKPVGSVPLRVANHLAPIMDWAGGVTMHRGIRGSGLEANITLP